jgi:hypothetical protein
MSPEKIVEASLFRFMELVIRGSLHNRTHLEATDASFCETHETVATLMPLRAKLISPGQTTHIACPA